MSVQFDEQEIAQLRQVLQRMGNFVALFEATEEKFAAREQAFEDKFFRNQKTINDQITSMRTLFKEFEGMMTEVGFARFRLAAENALKEGKEHLGALKEVTNEFLSHTKETCDRLDKATSYTVKGITQALNSFNIEEVRRLTNESTTQIREASLSTVNHAKKIAKWFHWKNVGLVLSITLVVTMITGLYLNDEWPWETHTQVMQQRNLAQAVINVWPVLSTPDKELILQSQPHPMG